MTTGHFDYLIIGQGLAGSLLAWKLIRKGKKVLVIDNQHQHSSSIVAAGLLNPLGGMRFNHSPFVFEWIDRLENDYSQLEKLCGQPLLHWMDSLRLFRSEQQFRFHQRRLDTPQSRPLLEEKLAPSELGQPVKAPWGGFRQHRTGFVALTPLLKCISRWLLDQQALRQHDFDYAQLHIKQQSVKYADITAGHIVFCEGYRAMRNPWFSDLPFAPDKGEILNLSPRQPHITHKKLPDTLVNGAHWLLPLPDGNFRFGATHGHRVFDENTTTEARLSLERGMQNLLEFPEALEISAQQAGVRPATADRLPFLGTHNTFRNLHIFNGFGAHGSLSIPWYSSHMVNCLLKQKPIPGFCSIERFAGRA